MRFNKIAIPDNYTKGKGIEKINIQRLGSVVAFVGKNGSGKSRILDLIEAHLFDSLTPSRIFDSSISHMPSTLERLKQQYIKIQKYFIFEEEQNYLLTKIQKEPENNLLHNELENLQRNLTAYISNPNFSHQINNLKKEFRVVISNLKTKTFRRIRNEQIRELQQTFTQNQSDSTIQFEKLFEKITDNDNYDEVLSINKSALKFLSKLPHELSHDKFDCIANSKKIEDKISHQRFTSLKKLIKDFLGKDLTWEENPSQSTLTEAGNNVTFSGQWHINGRPFIYNEFSAGEKYLFTYALLFFLLDQNPDLNIKESIILIDEPELHLHPASEIDLINGIRKVIGEKGQLIIATHSINILSHLNYDEIFMVKDNTIIPPSQSTPGASLSELMRLEDRVYRLSQFVNSISDWTYVNFMAQCFSNPEVIENAQPNDPQIEALKKSIISNSSKSNNILLDFGAGKGRLYEQLKSDYSFIDKINYYALEPEEQFHSRLKELGALEIYNSHNELPENLFDFIVICNVLHEIDIDKWVPTINRAIGALKESGFLIIIEAKILSKGEKINKTGYQLLGLDELKVLFELNILPSSVSIKGSEDRITCAIFQKSNLKSISKNSLINCLLELKKNTLEKIEYLRNNEHNENISISIGRQSAFLSQQYINVTLALKHLQPKNEKNKY